MVMRNSYISQKDKDDRKQYQKKKIKNMISSTGLDKSIWENMVVCPCKQEVELRRSV